MNLSITRQQRRTLMGGVEYSSYFKLDLNKQETEQIQHYISIMMQTFIGKVDPFFAGTTIDALRKGVEIKQKNVHKSMLIEHQVLKDLAAIRRYIAQASAFQGMYRFEIPLDIEDIQVPEGYVLATDERNLSNADSE